MAIFQFIYNTHDVDLSQTRYDLICKKAAAGVISPECLPPTKGFAAQHSLRAYSQNQDWLLLKSMSKDPNQYGHSIGERGYKPLTTLDDWAPLRYDNLLAVTVKDFAIINDIHASKVEFFVFLHMAHTKVSLAQMLSNNYKYLFFCSITRTKLTMVHGILY